MIKLCVEWRSFFLYTYNFEKTAGEGRVVRSVAVNFTIYTYFLKNWRNQICDGKDT